jgi:hypothetical protein
LLSREGEKGINATLFFILYRFLWHKDTYSFISNHHIFTNIS